MPRILDGPNSLSNGEISILNARSAGTECRGMIDRAQGPVAMRNPHVVAVIGFLVAMIDGFDTLMLAFIAPLISREWALHPQAVGTLFASSYAGAALGATLIGIAADRYGRKRMLLVSLALAGTFTLLCAWAASPAHLMALRAISGLGLGGALSTTIALTAESAPPGRRRATVTRMFLGFPVGAIVGGAATAATMSFLGWRGVFVAGGLCALFLVPLIAAGTSESRSSGTLVDTPVHSRRPIRELLSEGRALRTSLFCFCVFLMLLTSYFLVSWVPTVLTLTGLTPERAALSAVALNCGGILGTLILSFIIGRRSPLPPVIGSLIAGAVLIALLGHEIMEAGHTRSLLVFAVGLLIIGAQGGIPALCVHLYPPSVYATAAGLSVASGRLGSIIGPLIGGYLVSASLGWQRLFLLAAIPAFSAAIAMTALALSNRQIADEVPGAGEPLAPSRH
jgi:MFS transporter, AAHS family, 4-hydroxybenzoate transporter